MSIRKTFAVLAVAASLFAGAPAQAEDVDPDPATNQGYNDGENGLQAITVNVAVPNGTRSTSDDVFLKIAADCEFTTVGRPNTNLTELVAVAHASTTVHGGHGAPVSTGVSCRVTNQFGGVDIQTALPLNNVVGAETVEVRYSEFTVCISVSVHYNDDYFVRSREVCRLPISPI